MDMEKTGDFRNIQGEMKFEWEIKNFLQLSDVPGKIYSSPEFSFCGASWYINIFLNEYKNPIGRISFYINLKSTTKKFRVNFSFQLKTVNGKADISAKRTRVFDENSPAWGCSEFIPRSKFLERKAELLPSGILTVICTMRKSDTDDKGGSNTVNEYTQTDKETGCATVDAHSEGETGVYKLQQHFREILENGNVSDVVLKVEDREFKSHRCVLAARSPVFLAMMTHDTKEKNTGVVDIQDDDPNTFSDFLRYVYTGSEQIITSMNVVKLYTAADKYQVDELKKSCLDYMLTNISVDNFCDVLTLSLEHIEKDLTVRCTQFFIENTVAVISTPMWLTFLIKNPVAGNELHLKHLKSIMKNKN